MDARAENQPAVPAMTSSPTVVQMPAPAWSVMIPAYRCNEFLPVCLESVLAQDLGPARMQIAVVNDDPADTVCSDLVRTAGRGRVAYHHNERNLGAGGTFNRGLALATGDLVLLLHGDDYLKPAYFERLSRLATEHPNAGVIACRAEGVDQHGRAHWQSQRYPEFEASTRDDSPIWESLHLMPAAVVVRRDVYRRIGGFREDIANGQDWEMWSRAIRASGIVMTPEVLAAYRLHSANITTRTRRTGQSIRELGRLYRDFATAIPGYPLANMRRGLRGMAYGQALHYARLGDTAAAAANFTAWRELTPWPLRVSAHAKRMVKKILGRT